MESIMPPELVLHGLVRTDHIPDEDDITLHELSMLDRPLRDYERFELFRLTSYNGEDAWNGTLFD